MARRFGRLWSTALALALFFMVSATYYTLQPLKEAQGIIVEPESRVVLDDLRASPTHATGLEKETAQDGQEGKSTVELPEKVEEVPQEPTPEVGEVPTLKAPTPESEQPEQDATPSAAPTPPHPQEPPAPELAIPEPPQEPPLPPPPSAPETFDAESDVTNDTNELDEVADGNAIVGQYGQPHQVEGDEVKDGAEDDQGNEESPSEDIIAGQYGQGHQPEGYRVKEENEDSEVSEEPEEPPPPPPTKMLVIGRLSNEDTDWVQQELSDWQNNIYVVDLEPGVESPTGHRTKMNKAREAMPYLTYIVHHYPEFPDVVAFIHPHRRGMPMAWHNDARGNDAVNMMRDLRIDTVLDRGYVNLRCNNEVGCPDEVQPFRDPPDPKKYAEHAFPYVYGHFFNSTFTQMRESIPVVATQCCAQFAVSKDQILKRPKHEYERYRKFLEETHYDDATVGRVMEYMWHIIFGRDAVHCENMFECWCAVYGRCTGHGRGGWGSGRGGHP